MRTPALIAMLAMALPLGAAAQATPQPTGAQRERAEQAVERFRAADSNHDGQISRAEADASLPRIAKRFDQIDSDHDGQLSVEEFRAVAEKARARR